MRTKFLQNGRGTFPLRRFALREPSEIPAALALLRRTTETDESVTESVRRTLRQVRERGDAALLEEVRRFDWPCPGPEAFRVPPERIEAAWRTCPGTLTRALIRMERKISSFHKRTDVVASVRFVKRNGARLGWQRVPLDSVGLYVPGGRAAYPSTLLMLGVPARLAGVRRIAVATPADRRGTPPRAVLAAAHLLGLSEVYALGGAAAIAAFAYGTQSIERVDKIFGPGNAFVAEAKRQVFGAVGIDSIAGPTELVILSDGSAPPAYVAADLLAQAEHDPRATAVLITTDPREPERVSRVMDRCLRRSPRAEIQRESLAKHGALFVCGSLEVARQTAVHLAPEHLSIMVRGPVPEVPTAAAVFLGPWSAAAAGDYGIGPNHCLPTGGTARFSSPVSVLDFVRFQSRIQLTRKALLESRVWMEPVARVEGLDAHAASLRIRR